MQGAADRTERRQRVAELTAAGLGTGEIARRLGISHQTVRVDRRGGRRTAGSGDAPLQRSAREWKRELETYKRENDLIGSDDLAEKAGCNRSTPRSSKYAPRLKKLGLAVRYDGPWGACAKPWLYKLAAVDALKRMLEGTRRARSESVSAWMKERHARGEVPPRPRTGVEKPCDCGDPECGAVYRPPSLVKPHAYGSKACANKTAGTVRLEIRKERRRKTDRVTIEEAAADELRVSRATAYYYVERGWIPIAEVFEGAGAGPPVIHLARRDVRAFARERVRSSDPRIQRRFDPLVVYDEARASGLPRVRARELAELAVERERLFKKIRVGTGRPPSSGRPDYHFAWVELFRSFEAELIEYALEHGDRAPGPMQVCLAVAEADFASHGHLRSLYPSARGDENALDPDYARNAERTVWDAVKPLLSVVSGTRAA